MTAAPPKSQPSNATPGPWTISEVRSVEGEYLIVGGEGHGFGLIASCPVKADAEAIVAAMNAVAAGLRPYFDHTLLDQCKLGDYCKCCAGKPLLCPNYEGPDAVAQASWLPDLQFLLDRLEEFDPGDDEPEREFHGHVTPAIARLRSALSSTNRGGPDA